MGGVSRHRALWLSQHVLPHEAALRAWLSARRVINLDVDDIVQETYAKLAALDSVENIRNARGYFFRTAYSIVLTHVRRARIVPMQAIAEIEFLNLPSDEPLADRKLQDREQLQSLAEAIASMPKSCRHVFVLRRVHGLSQKEVARQLRISENTVEHHMTKAVALLVDLFGRGGKARSRSSLERDQPDSTKNEYAGNKSGES
jgi:RNA polymerase sigma factor (sigma-70 family)